MGTGWSCRTAPGLPEFATQLSGPSRPDVLDRFSTLCRRSERPLAARAGSDACRTPRGLQPPAVTTRLHAQDDL
jgi:hypothetical protein